MHAEQLTEIRYPYWWWTEPGSVLQVHDVDAATGRRTVEAEPAVVPPQSEIALDCVRAVHLQAVVSS